MATQYIYNGSIAQYRGEVVTVVNDGCCRECGHSYMANPHATMPRQRVVTAEGVLLRHVRPKSLIADPESTH